jgi:hypothetical protein
MQSFDMAKELCEWFRRASIKFTLMRGVLAERRSNDIGQLHAALDGSYANAPQQLDAEP